MANGEYTIIKTSAEGIDSKPVTVKNKARRFTILDEIVVVDPVNNTISVFEKNKDKPFEIHQINEMPGERKFHGHDIDSLQSALDNFRDSKPKVTVTRIK